MSGHTELPWRNIRGRIFSDVLPRDGAHDVCSMTVINNDVSRAEANAALIVTACNSHADLVRALEEIAAFNITPDTGASVAMRMRDIAGNTINAAPESVCDVDPSAPQQDLRTRIALEIWHRWADTNVEDFADETHKEEFLRCADAILALFTAAIFSALATLTARKVG